MSDQIPLPLGKPKNREEADAIALGRRTVVAHFVRHARARHYVLRVLPDGAVRVTMPRYGTRAEAVSFLRRQLRWVDLQRYGLARNDSVIVFRGMPIPLTVDQGSRGSVVRFGTEEVKMRDGEKPRAAACRHLRGLAERELPSRLRDLARQLDVPASRVTVRNQQTRWGSCSPDGAISLNWRLVQMPDAVRDYVLIHELMHVREGSHGRRFWRLVEQACPGHRAARRWLKEHENL